MKLIITDTNILFDIISIGVFKTDEFQFAT